jgi:hypothetical protein
VGLGVGAYAIVTGELPFGGASIWDIATKQMEGMKT